MYKLKSNFKIKIKNNDRDLISSKTYERNLKIAQINVKGLSKAIANVKFSKILKC